MLCKLCVTMLQDDMSHVIVTSLKSLEANNTWVKDDQSKRNNISAIYEWPGEYLNIFMRISFIGLLGVQPAPNRMHSDS